ncbi:sel1 repeat family protein [Entomomonas moraniae]|uniref:Sel1 repeat family protein n=1 Tax=Entomomonas moraniae TaxID=2213226 RepID=A0A3S9XC46_9GAMM|nr:tetratricopeptide repeat protein [Entomomonas moraniae]AZS49980.1 sel1 repeat family protein [Entomomonas moraniae]
MSVFMSFFYSLFAGILLSCNISMAQESETADVLFEKGVQYAGKQDYQQAMQWYLKAADEGNTDAMYNIGNLYAKGEGVEWSYQQAMQWWLKAADKGHINSMLMIGGYYYASTEYPEAMQWYLKAANKGSPNAMLRLGCLYKEGLGVKQDKEQAEFWYRKAKEEQK